MTANKLATYVAVRDTQHHAHIFGPDDTVPSWAVALITNPKAWDIPPHVQPDIPAKTGPKATASAWVAYATAQGCEIEDGATRKEIIAALEAENIPTE